VVLDGKVIGLWRRTIEEDRVVISHKLLRPLDQRARRLMKEAARRLGEFLGKEVELQTSRAET